VAVVVRGAQHREADEGEVCGMRKQRDDEGVLGTTGTEREPVQLPAGLTGNGVNV
jgi:hypothetical protein